MPFARYFDPNYEAPLLSDDIQKSCELAYDYFCSLLDGFTAKLPEHRQPLEFVDWLAEEPSLADRVNLIFPNGFGEYDQAKNHNPLVFPVLLDLSNAIHAGTSEQFDGRLCESWGKNFNAVGRFKEPLDLLHHILDYLTHYLEMFAIYADAESLCPEFSPDQDFEHWWTEINQRIAERYAA